MLDHVVGCNWRYDFETPVCTITYIKAIMMFRPGPGYVLEIGLYDATDTQVAFWIKVFGYALVDCLGWEDENIAFAAQFAAWTCDAWSSTCLVTAI